MDPKYINPNLSHRGVVTDFNATWGAGLTPNRPQMRTFFRAGLQGDGFFEIAVTAATPDMPR